MTNDEITRMAKQIWMAGESYIVPGIDSLARFAALVSSAEREACAKVCDHRKLVTPEWILDQHYNQAASHCAAAIRARGRK